MQMLRPRTVFVGIVVALTAMMFTGCRSSKPDSGHDKDSGTTISVKRENAELTRRFGFSVTRDDNTALYGELATWLGVPYKYAGNDRRGVDCSGLVCQVYQKVYNKKLQRSSAKIYEKNCREIARKKLREGDLVFFATGKDKHRISHVGIYLKNDRFIHASSSKGVTVSSLENPYFVRTYIASGRVE